MPPTEPAHAAAGRPSGLTGACSLSRVWRHGGRDHHLRERVCVYRQLPAREPAHRHRPPYAPELLTAPAAPAPAAPGGRARLAGSTGPEPPPPPRGRPAWSRGPAQQTSQGLGMKKTAAASAAGCPPPGVPGVPRSLPFLRVRSVCTSSKDRRARGPALLGN